MTLYAEQQDLALAQTKLESLTEDLQVLTNRRLIREGEMACLRQLYKDAADSTDANRKQGIVTMVSPLYNIFYC